MYQQPKEQMTLLTEMGVMRGQTDKFEKNKEFFNKNLYIEMIIEGINHSIFGNYGLQNKDGITEISNLKQ